MVNNSSRQWYNQFHEVMHRFFVPGYAMLDFGNTEKLMEMVPSKQKSKGTKTQTIKKMGPDDLKLTLVP
jgi:hypothetical protein